MAKKANHIIILFLAVLFLAGNLLNYPFYRFAIHHAKQEMRRELFGVLSHEEKSEAMEMTLSRSEYQRSLVDDGRELRINGEMYDIIQTTDLADGSVIVSCFHDKKEGLVHSWMKKVTNENSDHSPASSGKNGKLLKLSVSTDYLPSVLSRIAANNYVSVKLSYSCYDAGLCAGYQNLYQLPPKA